jgi:hypothetical protein
VAYLGGKKFRPRPIDKAVGEMAGIDNNRLFIVDNSLAQELKMFKLFQRVIEKEMANNTFRPRNRALASRAFGKKV